MGRRSPRAPYAVPCWHCRDSSTASASSFLPCASLARQCRRVRARRQQYAAEYRREADEMEEVELLVQKDDGEQRAEGGQEMDREAGAVGADRGHALVPAYIAEHR